MDNQETQTLDNNSVSSDCETDDGGAGDDEIAVLYGDTQPLDDPNDVDQGTEDVESGDEKTEVLDDGDEDFVGLGDDGDSRSCDVGERRNVGETSVVEAKIDNLADSVVANDNECDAAGSQRSFTEKRVEALRSSGLAASRIFTLKKLAGDPIFAGNGEHKKQEDINAAGESDSIDIRLTGWENNRKESTSRSIDTGDEVECKNQIAKSQKSTMNCYKERAKSRNTCTSAKKLFNDVLSCEEGETVNEDMITVEEACSKHPVGLSYVASQEPGVLSQVHALEVVDNFLLDNVMELSQDAKNEKSEIGESAVKLGTKGAISLAEKSNRKSPVGKAGMFDWDDALEDEGGGGFFSRTKDFFFNNTSDQPKTESYPPKARQHISKRKSSASSKKKGKAIVNSKIITVSACSDTQVVMEDSRRSGRLQLSHTRTKKNLFKDMSQESNSDSLEHHVADNVTDCVQVNIGPDTQMAAQAMETLINGLQEHGMLSAETSTENPNKKIVTKRLSDDLSPFKRDSVNDLEGVTTRSKKRKMLFLKQKMSAASSPADDEQSLGLKKSSESALKEKAARGKRKLATKVDARSPATRNTRSKSLEIKKAQGMTCETHFCNVEELKDPPVSNLHNVDSKELACKDFLVTATPVAHLTSSESALKEKTTRGKRKLATEVDDMNPPSRNTRSKSLKTQKAQGITCEPHFCNVEEHKDPPVSNLHIVDGMALRGKDFLVTATPVAHRTRHSKRVNLNNQSDNLSGASAMEDPKNCQNTDSNETLEVQTNSMSSVKGRKLGPIFEEVPQIRCIQEDAADHRKQGNSCKINSGFRNMNTICNGPSVFSDSTLRTEQLPKQGRRIYIRSVSDILDKGKQKRQSLLSNMELASKGMSSNTRKGTKVAGVRTRSSLIYLSSHQNMVSAANPKRSLHTRGVETSELGAGCITNAEDSATEKLCKEKLQTPIPVCKTPSKEANVASPVYSAPNTPISFSKGSGRSLISRELLRLESEVPSIRTLKDVRRRKDMASISVLFSRHLGEDTIKQQKKILTRLGLQVASSISDATHFVTDKFVRTQNMLEAIAAGKLVVTPLWIESCGQASCFIDDKRYILRDLRKEKEMGFNMTVSLARACQNPLLQGKKVLITPTVKPSRELIVSLVKAACGQAMERVGRSVAKQGKVPDDLLVISCEEDYTICRPLLEEGANVFSPELLLNGIVIQKLEYERHRLFLDHVKQNRSRMCLRHKQGG